MTEFPRFVRILAEDIIPLLEEYCYENYGTLTQILGKDLVDESKQRIREELFAPLRRQELVQALLSPAAEIVTSPQAALSPAKEEADELDDSEQDDGGK